MGQTQRTVGESPFKAGPVLHGRSETYEAALERARNAPPGKELETVFGPKKADDETDRWSALDKKNVKDQEFAAANGFKKRLRAIMGRDYAGLDLANEIQAALHSNIHDAIMRYKIAGVCERLQAYLDKMKGEIMDEQTQIANPATAEDWASLFKDFGVKSRDFIGWYNIEAVTNGGTVIAKLSEIALPIQDLQELVRRCAEASAAEQTPATPDETKQDAAEMANDQPTDAAQTQPKVQPFPYQTSVELMSLTTLVGIPAHEIAIWIDKPYPKKAYKNITARNDDDYWTDLDPYFVRNRLDKVFGPQGLGWRIIPTESGRVVYGGRETRTGKGNKEYSVYIVSLEMYCLEYALTSAAHGITYVRGSAVSSSQENSNLDYANAGALTGIMKQSLKMLGGFNHFAMD